MKTVVLLCLVVVGAVAVAAMESDDGEDEYRVRLTLPNKNYNSIQRKNEAVKIEKAIKEAMTDIYKKTGGIRLRKKAQLEDGKKDNSLQVRLRLRSSRSNKKTLKNLEKTLMEAIEEAKGRIGDFEVAKNYLQFLPFNECCPVVDDAFCTGYQGKIAKTETGKPCIRWVDVAKHFKSNPRLRLRAGFRPKLTMLDFSHNYCRNPDADSVGAWCFYGLDPSQWEHCGIPRCTDHCKRNPCGKYGYGCENVENNDYVCTCENGWSGKNCNIQIPWRNDYRCGRFAPVHGKPAECNPFGQYCCSRWGWCGRSSAHCDCRGCKKYSKTDKSDCWHHCGHKGGKCEWCGATGSCCKQGWKDKPGCDGNNGCASHHCCDKTAGWLVAAGAMKSKNETETSYDQDSGEDHGENGEYDDLG